MSDEQEDFHPHSLKQEQAIFADKPILLLGCGTQWGKTVVGGYRMKIALHTYTERSDNFIITAPSYKILNQSTLPVFLKLMDGFGDYNKKEDVFEMKNGGIVYCRTETDPDSIVGITNVRRIWGDEAGKYRLYFWQNIQARADFFGCPIDLTTSPYALNWVFHELIKPYQAGKRDDIDLIQAASWENPYHSLHDPEKRRQKRAVMDSRRFDMIYGGEWGKHAGTVYDCWEDDENLCEPFNLPAGTVFIGGLDWGFSPDPFVLKVRAITPEGKHYGVSEFYKTGLTPSDIVSIAQSKKATFGISRFYADPSQPGLIEEMNRKGLSVIPADNDIVRGIGVHYELIKTRKYKEFKGSCPHSSDERETYHYPDPSDLKPDQHAKEPKPVDQSNHCMDVDRYISIMTYRSAFKSKPFVPSQIDSIRPAETQEQRIRRLMRKKANSKTESWG